MEKHTDRILWTVLVLALGISLFSIFLPFGKAMMNMVDDNLSSIVTSQVSDHKVSYMPMSALFLIEKSHTVTAEYVGDPDIVAKCNTGRVGWHLVPNKPNKPMYLSIAADYDVKNIQLSPSEVDSDGGSSFSFLVNTNGGPGILPQYRVLKHINPSDIGTSSHGTLYERWKLPPESGDNVKITNFFVYYINADKLTINNVRIGLEGGSFKLE